MGKEKSGIKNAFIVGLMIGTAAMCAAQNARVFTPGNQADTDEIVRRLENNQVFDTSVIQASITTENRLGKTTQEITSRSRRNGDTLIEITAGPDRGQKILRLETSVYLYYPDAEEVIRLQGAALKDSMMGSDFSYEDLTGSKSVKDSYNVEFTGTADVDGYPCYTLVLTAKTRSVPYQKEELYVDEELFTVRKAVYYSASGKALRELSASDFSKVAGIPFPHKTVMRDLLKRNSSTAMSIRNVELNVPISASYFSREELSW